MFSFSNYSAKSKHNDDSNALVVGKIRDKMVGADIEEFAALKPKLYSILVNHSHEYKKARGVKKNVVAKISHNK